MSRYGGAIWKNTRMAKSSVFSESIRNYLELEAVNSGCINNVIYDRLNNEESCVKINIENVKSQENV